TGCGIISIGRYRHQTPKRTDSTTPGTTTASLALATPRSWQQRSHYESSSHHTYSQRVEADHEPASPFWWRSAVFAVASGRRGESIVGGSPSSQSRLPTAPSNLAASGVSATQINLSWHDNSGNESGFTIQRSVSSAGP